MASRSTSINTNGDLNDASVRVTRYSTKCESHNFQPATCTAAGLINDLKSKKRHSKSKCTRGKSYFITCNKILVKNECRSTFKYTINSGTNYTRMCQSWNFETVQCPVGKVLDEVIGISKALKSLCVMGNGFTFGPGRRIIIVKKGCRVRFFFTVLDPESYF